MEATPFFWIKPDSVLCIYITACFSVDQILICVHTVQNQTASMSKIMHFISYEKLCALHSKSSDTKNKICYARVLCRQLWTESDTLCLD